MKQPSTDTPRYLNVERLGEVSLDSIAYVAEWVVNAEGVGSWVGYADKLGPWTKTEPRTSGTDALRGAKLLVQREYEQQVAAREAQARQEAARQRTLGYRVRRFLNRLFPRLVKL